MTTNTNATVKNVNTFSTSINSIARLSGYSVSEINVLVHGYQNTLKIKGWEIALIHNDMGKFFLACKENVGKKEFLAELKQVFGTCFDKDYRAYAMQWTELIKQEGIDAVKSWFYSKQRRTASPRGYMAAWADDHSESENENSDRAAFDRIKEQLERVGKLIDKNGMSPDEYRKLSEMISDLGKKVAK